MTEPATSAEMITKIQNRDRKYRMFFSILMVIVILVLGGVAYLQAQTIQQFKDQSAERAAGLQKLQEDNLKASGRTNAYLQCIARFFAEQDRADLQLTDLDACSYERNGQQVPGVDITPTSSGESPNLTPAPQQQEPQTPPTSPAQPQHPVLPEVPKLPQNPQHPPMTVLGIPVCLPFTDICARQ